MAIRQTRVFVHSNEPDDWAETLIGRLFRPLTEEFSADLAWFWFSRYRLPAVESGDCDIGRIPPEYKAPIQGEDVASHRSMRFRYAIADESHARFEERIQQGVLAHGYCISDCRPYDDVADTGGRRFLGVENNLSGRAQQRAQLVTQFYMLTSRLVIDALVGPDKEGRYRLETNEDTLQNPAGSTFQSLLHLFCNITDVPTDVYIFRKEGLNILGCGTFMHPPPAPPGGWDDSTAYPIWF